jgi:hypothetical protein
VFFVVTCEIDLGNRPLTFEIAIITLSRFSRSVLSDPIASSNLSHAFTTAEWVMFWDWGRAKPSFISSVEF